MIELPDTFLLEIQYTNHRTVMKDRLGLQEVEEVEEVYPMGIVSLVAIKEDKSSPTGIGEVVMSCATYDRRPAMVYCRGIRSVRISGGPETPLPGVVLHAGAIEIVTDIEEEGGKPKNREEVPLNWMNRQEIPGFLAELEQQGNLTAYIQKHHPGYLLPNGQVAVFSIIKDYIEED